MSETTNQILKKSAASSTQSEIAQARAVIRWTICWFLSPGHARRVLNRSRATPMTASGARNSSLWQLSGSIKSDSVGVLSAIHKWWILLKCSLSWPSFGHTCPQLLVRFMNFRWYHGEPIRHPPRDVSSFCQATCSCSCPCSCLFPYPWGQSHLHTFPVNSCSATVGWSMPKSRLGSKWKT